VGSPEPEITELLEKGRGASAIYTGILSWFSHAKDLTSHERKREHPLHRARQLQLPVDGVSYVPVR